MKRNGETEMKELVLVDTDVLIDAARGLEKAVAYLSKLAPEKTLAMSVINYMELLVGCRNKREQSRLDRFVTAIHVIPLDEEISWKALDLLKQYRLSHGLLIADSLIAATCLNLGRKLATGNKKHFRFIEGLHFEEY